LEKFKRLRQQLRQLLDDNTSLLAPSAYDSLSAKIIEKVGFPLVYVGSYGVSAAKGLPDVGLLTLDELVSVAGAVVNAVQVPVLADAENGFYHPANIWRMVQAYEQAGVAGIHIDDHVSGKHSNLPPRMLTQEQLLKNLHAALQARTDPDFLIIGRTDIAWATGDAEQAVERMVAMLDAGADLVFPTGLTHVQLAEIRQRIPGKIICVYQEGATAEQQADAAISITIYHSLSLYAAADAVTLALTDLKNAEHGKIARQSQPVAALLDQLLDYKGFNARGQRYL